MPPTVEGRPVLHELVVTQWVRGAYGLEGTLSPLAAEWDQNFRLDTAGDGSFVIKLANSGIATAELELQNAALQQLAGDQRRAAAPRVVPTSSGETICVGTGEANGVRMRLLTYLPGAPLSSLPAPSTAVLHQLGEMLG